MASTNPALAQDVSKLEQNLHSALNRISALGRDAAKASASSVPGLDLLTLSEWSKVANKARNTVIELEKTLKDAQREKARYENISFQLQRQITVVGRATSALDEAKSHANTHQEHAEQIYLLGTLVTTHEGWIHNLDQSQGRLVSIFETEKAKLAHRIVVLEGKELLAQVDNDRREETLESHGRQLGLLESSAEQAEVRDKRGIDETAVRRNEGKELFSNRMAPRVTSTPQQNGSGHRAFTVDVSRWRGTKVQSSQTAATPGSGSKRKAPYESSGEGEILEHVPTKAMRGDATDIDLTSLNHMKARILKDKQRDPSSTSTLEAGFSKAMARIQGSRSGTPTRTGAPQQDQTPPLVTVKSHQHLFDALKLPPEWTSKQVNRFREEFNEIASRFNAHALRYAFDKNAFRPAYITPRDNYPYCLLTELKGRRDLAAYDHECKGCRMLKNPFCVYLVRAELGKGGGET